MIPRALAGKLSQSLSESPAVVLVGPRQVGKTTLALETGHSLGALYLDLESERDRSKLAEPELYLAGHLDRLVILDEIHRLPALFPVLRSLIDRSRRDGRRHGLYLLLGSASLDLLKYSGETLAGRVSQLELAPFMLTEVVEPQDPGTSELLWLRGGFPDSFLASSAARSVRWREDFMRSYLERDIPMFRPRIPSESLRRLWTMLAHLQGSLLNVAELARSLGVDVKTAGSYVDLLVDLLLVRRLPAWHSNLGKRLVRAPKIYLRDSGLLHALLGVDRKETLLGHPVLGASWEGFVIENLLAAAERSAEGHFYRTSAGAEIDLLLRWRDGTVWAIEVKRTLRPKLERGFREACEDLHPQRRFLVYPGEEAFPLDCETQALSPVDLARMIQERGRGKG